MPPCSSCQKAVADFCQALVQQGQHPVLRYHTFNASHAAAENMLQAAYLTIGKLAPDYENVELSVGGSTVAAAVVEATGRISTGSAVFSCV